MGFIGTFEDYFKLYYVLKKELILYNKMVMTFIESFLTCYSIRSNQKTKG